MSTRAEKDAAVRARDEALGVSPHPQNVWRRVGSARQMIHAPERGRDVIVSVKRDETGSVYVEMCKLDDSGVGIAEITSITLAPSLAAELAAYLRGAGSGTQE